MKNLLVLLVLCGVGWAQSHKVSDQRKPYHNVLLKVVKVETNTKGVRLIWAVEQTQNAAIKGRSFWMTCNDDADTCEVPALDTDYRLLDLHQRIYECDNYTLARGTAKDADLIAVCLKSVN